MPDLLDDMARAAFAVHAAENDPLDWDDLDPEARNMFRRSVAAALRVALEPLAGPDHRLEGVRDGRHLDALQNAFIEACRGGR